jgi:tetratricopeptide (TPR) repeat protein/tRNA A-37 threonylcarbamoyl transferase component Bud32
MTDESTWFGDHDLLLAEIRRGRRSPEAAPDIPGYDAFTPIGRGGQGVVFQATQVSTRRRVAVKVLLDGAFASAAARRRFEREIEMVAALEHPGIVRLFDSGTASDGRLYTVMEFIEGVTLERWMAARPRARAPDTAAWLRARMELAIAIGDAVHHAHQRGIIHRDLKPGNVLVDQRDRPHVLDFGLARHLDPTGEGGGRTISAAADFLGSVPWASPEQADGRSSAADVRTDIYALGVIAYQLATGERPYDTTGPLMEALEHIRSTPPRAPRLANPDIGRDLETVLLKALAKEPERRYQSAGDFVADLARSLRGEAIDARRDSALYVARMMARRHRLPLGALALAVLALVAGAGATFWQWRSTEAERVRADRRFEQVRGLARTVMFDIHDAIQDLPGSSRARQLLANTAMEYLASLAAESGGSAPLLVEIAQGHQRVGDIVGNPFFANLGDTAGAQREYEQGLAVLVPLVERGDDAAMRVGVVLLTRLGDVLVMRGERTEATAQYELALAQLDLLAARGPLGRAERRLVAAAHLKIGDALTWSQDPKGALARLETALGLLEALAAAPDAEPRDQQNLAICCGKVGYMLGVLGRTEEALARHRQALALSKALAAAEPGSAVRARGVQINHNQVGAMLMRLERRDEALEHFHRAFESAREQAAADPDNRLARSDLAYTHNKIGEALWPDRAEEALPHFAAALAIRRALAAEDAGNAVARRDLAVSLLKVAEALATLAEGTAEGGAEGASADASEAASAAAPARGAERTVRLREAIAHYDEAISELDAMRAQGTLADVDRSLADTARAERAHCVALAAAP